MKFEVSEMGNRVIIRTMKENGMTKVTPLEYNKAFNTIRKLKACGENVVLNGEMSDYRIKSLF